MRIAFIGLGDMGSGMAANQAKAGREVAAFDLSVAALARGARLSIRRSRAGRRPPSRALQSRLGGGVSTAMMLKDLKLVQAPRRRPGLRRRYAHFERQGYGGLDFSAILQLIRGRTGEFG